jgi:hypothetical protein
VIFPRYIDLRKFIAAFLLFLFAFVYVEKLLHQHECQTSQQAKGFTLAHQNSKCSICDFKLAKDVELPTSVPLEKPALVLRTEFNSQSSQIFLVPVFYISGRAPPFS